jgi:hypothetical protein
VRFLNFPNVRRAGAHVLDFPDRFLGPTMSVEIPTEARVIDAAREHAETEFWDRDDFDCWVIGPPLSLAPGGPESWLVCVRARFRLLFLNVTVNGPDLDVRRIKDP